MPWFPSTFRIMTSRIMTSLFDHDVAPRVCQKKTRTRRISEESTDSARVFRGKATTESSWGATQLVYDQNSGRASVQPSLLELACHLEVALLAPQRCPRRACRSPR